MTGYFHILSHQASDTEHTFSVELLPDCAVYQGHFPGQPVSPGACNLEMIRQCASLAASCELRFASIRQCRYLQLITPSASPLLTLRLTLAAGQLSAQLLSDEAICITLKATVR